MGMFLSLLGCTSGRGLAEQWGALFRRWWQSFLMKYLETELLPTITALSPLWIRYVEDILLMSQNEDNFEGFLSEVNSLAPNIRFTVQWKEGEKIPILDTMTHKLPTGFSFAVYRKTMHSGQYLHYFSGHPKKIKQCVLLPMFLRAYRICNGSSLQVEISYIQKPSKDWATHNPS